MTTNKQTLENIEATLNAIALHLMGRTPGAESAPETATNDQLDEVLTKHTSVNTLFQHGESAFRRLEQVGRPCTIRNVLKELMRRETVSRSFTVISEKTGKVYCIYLASRQLCTHSGGKTVTMYSTSSFSIPRLAEGGLVGWRIGDFAQVLEAFEMNDDQYLICEMLGTSKN